MEAQELNKSFIEKLMWFVRVKKDFPREGVSFLDFNLIFANPQLLKEVAQHFLNVFPLSPGDVVLAPEARGFILAPVIASMAGCGFVPLRKKGKLPDFGSLKTESYSTEYSGDALCLDLDLCAAFKGKNVLIYDDVLATGGTAAACAKLAEQFNPSFINFAFLAEIAFLEGRSIPDLDKYVVHSLLTF